jgi:hypothetical protein
VLELAAVAIAVMLGALAAVDYLRERAGRSARR